jgi:hypothetical protein
MDRISTRTNLLDGIAPWRCGRVAGVDGALQGKRGGVAG